MSSSRLSWIVALACPALAACESVPDLAFVGLDGSAGDATGSDAHPSDARNDAPAQEAGGDAMTTCLGAPPGGANICCTDTWCGGTCAASDCATCISSCGSSKICCKLNNNIVCRNAGTGCP